MFNMDEHLNDTMKKTLEENNKERDVNLFPDNNSSRYNNTTFKYSSAPVSNKNSDGHESIFSNSMKLAAFRASELRKRNKDLVHKYGTRDLLTNSKLHLDFIKKLHNAAMTIQVFWRDYILNRRTPLFNEDKNEYDISRFEEVKDDHPNNNRSTSRNACSIPKLDLSQVGSKKELESNNLDGIFNQEPLIDLSTKRIQNLLMTSDVTSMIKVREEALNYKIKKEKSKIQTLLSSQKISPRTGNFKELELEKWVDQERQDIDKTKQIYEENRKRTEEIIRDTMGVDNLFSNYELTQETLKRLFADKVTTPREGHSYRSGFNSSRRLYELNQINKQIIDGDDFEFKHHRSASSVQDHENIVVSGTEDDRGSLTLKQKIELKIRAEQEITFEKNKDDYFFRQDTAFENDSDDLLDAFKDKKLNKKRSYEDHDNNNSSDESPIDILKIDPTKINSKTPNLFDNEEDRFIESGKKLSPKQKDTSKSLDISTQFKRGRNEEGKGNKDDPNNASLVRIKSEHNLKEEKSGKGSKITESKKDKTYNSKNFFTENFDDQEMDDAINKIKSNPEFDQNSPSPFKLKSDLKSEEIPESNQNIDFIEEETISFDENNWKIDLGETLNRNNQHKIKAIIESANADYNSLISANIVSNPKSSNAILVDDEDRKDHRDDLGEDSSNSDHFSSTKTQEDKKPGFVKLKNKFENMERNKKISNLFDTANDDSNDKVSNGLDTTKHSKSYENIQNQVNLPDNNHPISNIDIERIGSPNKPKFSIGSPDSTGHQQHLKDNRQKIDDSDEDEEEIITGSHIINSSNANKLLQEMDNAEGVNSNSMTEYFKHSKLLQNDNITGDIKVVIDEICQNLIKELDNNLFPQRPLFLLTADLSGISLEQATTLLNDLTPEKERILVEKIIERQNEQMRRKKSGKSSTDTSKLVLYEKKGIRTDLVAIENYVEALYKHIDQSKKKEFMKKLFTPIKHDPFEMLNQLQNSDIGSYEHFQVDMNILSALQLDTYLEMENYWKKQEIEEEKVQELDQEDNPIDAHSKSRKSKHKRKRFEFDHSGLSKEEIDKKKNIFRECEHIHNKALFD